jgi:hypothetical protein
MGSSKCFDNGRFELIISVARGEEGGSSKTGEGSVVRYGSECIVEVNEGSWGPTNNRTANVRKPISCEGGPRSGYQDRIPYQSGLGHPAGSMP